MSHTQEPAAISDRQSSFPIAAPFLATAIVTGAIMLALALVGIIIKLEPNKFKANPVTPRATTESLQNTTASPGDLIELASGKLFLVTEVTSDGYTLKTLDPSHYRWKKSELDVMKTYSKNDTNFLEAVNRFHLRNNVK